MAQEEGQDTERTCSLRQGGIMSGGEMIFERRDKVEMWY